MTSCSLFIQNFQHDILTVNKIKPLSLTNKTTCENKKADIVISENPDAQTSFKRFIDKVQKEKKLQFIDKVVLWALLQMNYRPDLSAPTSKLQLLLKINNKEEYFNNFSNQIGSFPYLNGLNNLLKKYKSRYSLKDHAKLIDRHFHSHFIVSKGFESFLATNKQTLANNKQFKKTYFRGNEPLKELETIPKINFSRIVAEYFKTRKKYQYKTNRFLFHYKSDLTFVPQCNFDMGLYRDSLFLINEKKIVSHTFGLKIGDDSMLAVSGQDYAGLNNIPNTFLLTGKSDIRSASICTFKSKLKKKRDTLWLISTNSRDPGQHLHHLLQYGLNTIQSAAELNTMMKFSRHLFLKDPVRLVIESRRSSEKQLSELLKLNIPIYNAKKLGTVWGYYQNSKGATFVLDDRRKGHLECTSK